jgi:transaldolase
MEDIRLLSSSATRLETPLHKMARTTPTCLWNDSASITELRSSIEDGAVGATCNPVIVAGILKKELSQWRARIQASLHNQPCATEDDIGWAVVREMSVEAAGLLEPIFKAESGRNGRLSIQTDPRLFRNAKAMVLQAEEFNALAPNMIVKIPATRAGIVAMEEATYRGISVNATVCFTLPQCVDVADAVERGLARREHEGKSVDGISPVCTIMVGRLDDWLKVTAEHDGVTIDPGYLEWAGVAVFKKTYWLFQERGYRIRLLSAAFRNHMHWSEFIGGDVVISPPYSWQVRFNASDIPVCSRIDRPVAGATLDVLRMHFPDFRRAMGEDAFSIEDFDTFGATRRTLRQFIGACADLNAIVRDQMIPNPD